MTEKIANPHKGHRAKVLENIMENGLDELRDHEVLEALLFFSIPQKDTNVLAHNLTEHFGSLKQVLEADYEELLTVKGITPNSAKLICFSQALAKRYLQLDTRDSLCISDTETLKNYSKTLFLGDINEKLYCLCLSHDLRLIKTVLVDDGEIGQVEIPARKLAEIAICSKCERIIITHNHPQGSCMPSRKDMAATRDVAEALRRLDIRIVDHLIVGVDGVWSIRQTGAMEEIWDNG